MTDGWLGVSQYSFSHLISLLQHFIEAIQLPTLSIQTHFWLRHHIRWTHFRCSERHVIGNLQSPH